MRRKHWALRGRLELSIQSRKQEGMRDKTNELKQGCGNKKCLKANLQIAALEYQAPESLDEEQEWWESQKCLDARRATVKLDSGA